MPPPTRPVFPRSSDLRNSLSELSFAREEITPLQAQTDGLASGFVRQATQWQSLAAMVAGGAFFRLGRAGILGLSSQPAGISLQILSHGAGLVSEVTAFEISHRALLSLDPGHSPSLSQPFWQGWRSSMINFGLLRMGAATRGQSLSSAPFQDASMVAGNQLSSQMGQLRTRGISPRNFSSPRGHALAIERHGYSSHRPSSVGTWEEKFRPGASETSLPLSLGQTVLPPKPPHSQAEAGAGFRDILLQPFMDDDGGERPGPGVGVGARHIETSTLWVEGSPFTLRLSETARPTNRAQELRAALRNLFMEKFSFVRRRRVGDDPRRQISDSNPFENSGPESRATIRLNVHGSVIKFEISEEGHSTYLLSPVRTSPSPTPSLPTSSNSSARFLKSDEPSLTVSEVEKGRRSPCSLFLRANPDSVGRSPSLTLKFNSHPPYRDAALDRSLSVPERYHHRVRPEAQPQGAHRGRPLNPYRGGIIDFGCEFLEISRSSGFGRDLELSVRGAFEALELLQKHLEQSG